MTSTTNNEPQDVEAPTIGGIVLGVATNKKEEDAEKSDGESPAQPMIDTTILMTTFLYTLMIVVLFFGPGLASSWSNDDPNESSGGFDGLLRGLAIMYASGVGALIVATVGFVLTLQRWNQLHTMCKAMGVFPVVSAISIIILLAVRVSIQLERSDTTSSSPVVPECAFNSTDCKNSTGSL